MIATLLLLAASPTVADGAVLAYALPPAAGRLSASPQAPARPSRYRVAAEPDGDPTAKDRAFADDGTHCNVVGAKRCTSRGRTIFTTDFTE